jgi:hypothetical protein
VGRSWRYPRHKSRGALHLDFEMRDDTDPVTVRQNTSGGTQMSSTPFVVARGQQLAGFLLSTVPLAERMLLYQVATTAWLMLPAFSKKWTNGVC